MEEKIADEAMMREQADKMIIEGIKDQKAIELVNVNNENYRKFTWVCHGILQQTLEQFVDWGIIVQIA